MDQDTGRQGFTRNDNFLIRIGDNNFVDKFKNYVIKLRFKNISISYERLGSIIKEGNCDLARD